MAPSAAPILLPIGLVEDARQALEASVQRRTSPRTPAPCERDALVSWLDQGLRRGLRGRLEDEYPVSLTRDRRADHRVVYAGSEPLAHAMLHETVVVSRGSRLRVGLIGLVYTAPRARRAGLAGRCIAACLDELARRGVALALLWSDRPELYRRLGFEPAGIEEQLRVGAETCRRARKDGRAGTPRLRTAPVRAGDFPALEALYAAKPVASLRAPGALARLAAAPETQLVAARHGERPVAYAALGRGDDFRGVVHEWAGASDGVLVCWQSLCERHGELDVLSGPLREPPVTRVLERGAPLRAGCFALARILDPQALWRSVTSADADPWGAALGGKPDAPRLRTQGGALELSHGEALALLFGRQVPLRVRAALAPAERSRIAGKLPFPLYLWGFDSV